MDERFIAVNISQKVRLASQVEIAESIFKRMKGLLGRAAADFTAGCGLWIIPCNGIHTFAMRFPIDAVYLDSKHRVLRLCHELQPFRLAPISLRTQSVLELPAGTLAGTGTKIGDIIEFQPVTQNL